MRNTYLSNWYWKVKQRRGGKKALIALARKILTIIYSILKDKENQYHEEMFQDLQERLAKRRQEKMIKELEKSGLIVSVPERIA